jgi:hypothetical protein
MQGLGELGARLLVSGLWVLDFKGLALGFMVFNLGFWM